jgi:hypothetical protein
MRTVFVENRERKKDPAGIVVSNSVTVSIDLNVIEGGDLKKQNQLPIQIHFFFPISLL